jgi:GxxExxY protein
MHTDKDKINDITEKVIGCAFKVGNKLGIGFLEKCYENALALELRKLGVSVSTQHPIQVLYDGEPIGEYVADLLVEDTVIVELKAGKGLDDAHSAQCINYLVATGRPVCLLIHFGKRVDVKRILRPGTDLAL